mmetsp:Transcript_18434/g.20838  ORF Transcript_18434/g.20838 Transcript_18434/m.20838 type:complete len:156 (+) Transcript_18434:44-511(+)
MFREYTQLSSPASSSSSSAACCSMFLATLCLCTNHDLFQGLCSEKVVPQKKKKKIIGITRNGGGVVTAATGAAICRTFKQKFNTTTGTDEGDGDGEQEQYAGIVFPNLQFQPTSRCQRQRQRQRHHCWVVNEIINNHESIESRVVLFPLLVQPHH